MEDFRTKIRQTALDLEITTSLIAGMLGLTERSLFNPPSDEKRARIERFIKATSTALNSGISKGVMLNFLHEPLNPLNEESPSLLWIITDEPSQFEVLLPIYINNFICL